MKSTGQEKKQIDKKKEMKIGKRKIWKIYPNKKNEDLENRIKEKGRKREGKTKKTDQIIIIIIIIIIKTIHGKRRR